MTSTAKRSKQEPEEIEGLDENLEEVNSPFHSLLDSVLIRQETRTVYDIVRRIEQGKFILQPDFQRDFVWDQDTQSKLIESCFLRIPLPVFYLAEQHNGTVIVVDGQQRLTTFKRFLNNEFALSGLSGNPAFNRKTFQDIPPVLQNRLEDTQLILYLIDHKASERARLDIFERVNSGYPLTRQQMRNCLYMGQATRWLKEQAQTNWFLEATGMSLDSKTMRDREVINRFCGFYLLGFEKYEGDLDEFLAKTLQYMNEMKSTELDSLTKKFRLSMENNFFLYGKNAFRKHSAGDMHKGRLNIALFDVFSTYLANYSQQEVKNKATKLKTGFYSLLEDGNFWNAISSGTNSQKNVQSRFELASQALKEALK